MPCELHGGVGISLHETDASSLHSAVHHSSSGCILRKSCERHDAASLHNAVHRSSSGCILRKPCELHDASHSWHVNDASSVYSTEHRGILHNSVVWSDVQIGGGACSLAKATESSQ